MFSTLSRERERISDLRIGNAEGQHIDARTGETLNIWHIASPSGMPERERWGTAARIVGLNTGPARKEDALQRDVELPRVLVQLRGPG